MADLTNEGLGELMFSHLEHDLHFRPSSFVPSLAVRQPTSLAGALVGPGETKEAVCKRWSQIAFDDLLAEVKGGVARELVLQGIPGDGFATWLGEFIRVFERVEYIVNVRLIHALYRIPPAQLSVMVSRLLRVDLGGDPIRVAFPARESSDSGPNWYHVAQDDGVLAGEHNAITLELKACGKTTGTKVDAAQVAKHLWLRESIVRATQSGLTTHTLVVLPCVNGTLRGLATDLVHSDGEIRAKLPGNATLGKFLAKRSPDQRARLTRRLEETSVRAVSFDDVADAAADAGVMSAIVHDLRRVADTSRAPTQRR